MCGIAGIFAYDRNAQVVERSELIRIRDAMYARGPDGEGAWLSEEGRIGLAHRRLSIIDLSDAATQPMMLRDGELLIVFNGEIYNYLELRADLSGKGHVFRTQSDTEVLLHLYVQYGRGMVEWLRGMFAFAIWDAGSRGVFLARDHFGIKPLYYSDNGRTLRFASQVKALLRGQNVDTAPEPAGHVGFYLWGHVPEPYTLYKGIRSLDAGSSLWIDESGAHEKRTFFRLSEELHQASGCDIRISREDRDERLRHAISDSVRHHMIADVPVGLFLSAGLDSATLTAHASALQKEGLHTITLGFEEYRGTRDDETVLAEEISLHYGTTHQTKWVMKEDFSGSFENLLMAMDQPTIDGVNSYFVSKVAAESGMKVALSGVGGDELFGGYPSFTDVPRMVSKFGRFERVPRIGRAFRWVAAPILKGLTSPKYAGLLEYGGNYGGAYLLRRGLFMPWELPQILDAELVREGWKELDTMARLDETIQGITKERAKVMALEMVWYMQYRLLRDTDWAGMAHSLEIRTPLVDIGLFRQLAPMLTSDAPPSKLDMAGTPEKKLPTDVLQRPKSGFSIPVREWLHEGSSKRGLRSWAMTLMKRQS